MPRIPPALLLAALLLAPAATATPYEQLCPAGGTAPPCVTVTLLEKVGDVVPVAAAPGLTATAYVGDLTGYAGSQILFDFTIAVAAVGDGTTTVGGPALLQQDAGPLHLHFDTVETLPLAVVTGAAPGTAVASVWLAEVRVTLTPSLYESVLVPIVVPA